MEKAHHLDQTDHLDLMDRQMVLLDQTDHLDQLDRQQDLLDPVDHYL